MLAILGPACINSGHAETSVEDIEIPDGYPLESAEYDDYADCVNENPDDSVDCVKNRYGITYALASFPTTEQKDSEWYRLEEAWSQIGTAKKLSKDRRGEVTEYNPNKPIPGSAVYEYEFREYNDYYNVFFPDEEQ